MLQSEPPSPAASLIDPQLHQNCHFAMVMVLYNGMQDVFIPIDKAGRVVLPKDVRDELAIRPGDLLKVSIHGEEVTLRPSKEASGFIRRGQALVFSSAGADLLDHETVEAIRATESETRLGRLSQGLPPRRRK
jgi:AbrB family looped-hinge helix DNA binding protein